MTTALEPDTRAEQAGLWWVRLREADVSPEEISQWLDWCQADPANLQAFEAIDQLGGRLATLDANARAELTRELLAPSPSDAPRLRPSRLQFRVWRPVLAAAASLLVGVGIWQYRTDERAAAAVTYATQRGQQRDVALDDGSHVALGGLSSVVVRYSGQRRQLQLDAGEAYFEVAPNPQRPFVVQVGAYRVTAVGTAFNIRRTGKQVEVAVVHGTVDVREAEPHVTDADSLRKLRVQAGHQVVAGSQTPLDWSLRPSDTQQALSWRSGSMAFIDESLARVVDNVNRYAAQPIVLADASLAELRYTGTVIQGREADWVEAIEAAFPVRAERDGQGRMLLSARSR